MKLKKINQESIYLIQQITIKHGKIKLHIYPQKIKFNNEANYGDEVYTTKFHSYIDECTYKEKDIPFLKKLIRLRNFINKANSYDAIQMLFILSVRNKGDYKITVVPYPDDITEKRIKDVEKILKKIK